MNCNPCKKYESASEQQVLNNITTFDTIVRKMSAPLFIVVTNLIIN